MLRFRDMAEKLTLEQRVRRFVGFDDVARRVDSVSSRLAELISTIRRPPPGPFVCVLVEGLAEARAIHVEPLEIRAHTELRRGMLDPGPVVAVRRMWTGGSGRVPPGGGAIVELTAQLRLHDVRVIVFADLERVRVRAIFVGTEHLTCAAAFGDCPVASFERWEPGVKLRVQCDAVES